jgi:hydrogenase maturation protease
MTPPRVLIACIGNIFLGDDGFGTEVARRLASRPLPEGVILKDFGIRGFDLTYALLEPYELIILVDTCVRGEDPGTIYVIKPEAATGPPAPLATHGINPSNVLRLVQSMGGTSAHILVVGCEPADLGPEEEGKLGLSDPVAAAIDEAVAIIDTLVSNALNGVSMETEGRHYVNGSH